MIHNLQQTADSSLAEEHIYTIRKGTSMYIVKLHRYGSSLEKEYGRVMFDGAQVTYSGLTQVFQKYLQLGIRGIDGTACFPEDGLRFMSSLTKLNEVFSGELRASDVILEEDAAA